MSEVPVSSRALAASQLTLRQHQILGLLAVAGPVRRALLDNWLQRADAELAGIRYARGNPPRPVIEELLTIGLLVESDTECQCAPQIRVQLLRDLGRERRLNQFADLVETERQNAGDQWGTQEARRRATTIQQVMVGLYSSRESVVAQTERIESALLVELLDRDVFWPALTDPFDAAWLAGLPESLRCFLLDRVLNYAERLGLNPGKLYPHLVNHPEDLSATSRGLESLGALAILRGDFEVARNLAADPRFTSELPGLTGLLAFSEGRSQEALLNFSGLAKRSPAALGVAGVIQPLMIMGRGGVAEFESAQRMTKSRARSSGVFRDTHGVLKAHLDVIMSSGGANRIQRQNWNPGKDDCLLLLAHDCVALWYQVPQSVVIWGATRAEQAAKHWEQVGQPWLQYQYHTMGLRLEVKLQGMRGGQPISITTARAIPALGNSVADLRKPRAPWESPLEALERLGTGESVCQEASGRTKERLFWRVGADLNPEPYLQTRTNYGWSVGQKLSVKNLMPQSPQLIELPPEDARVAPFAREERLTAGSLSEARYYLTTAVWQALVGHPRVHLNDEAFPSEVVRGNVQLVASTEEGTLHVRIEPPDLHAEVQPRVEGRRVVVYSVPESLRPLMKIVGKGLEFPSSTKPRVLDALARLTHLVPVHAAADSATLRVPADARPLIRLIPRGAGLAVSLSVRPLGDGGQNFHPGAGTRTVTSRRDGIAVQAERDFYQERALADALLEACSGVDLRPASKEYCWTVDHPQSCLELISCLSAEGDRVHVEWPHGRSLRLRARVGCPSLRGGLQHTAGFFFATGRLQVDSDLSLDLGELLALVGSQQGRFIQLKSGEFLELERQLRDTLDTIIAVRSRPGEGDQVAIPFRAVSVLDMLARTNSGFELDAESADWSERFDSAFKKQFRVPRGLDAELRSYQVDGFRWMARLAELGLGACLADDMGLGKTLQIIALLLHRAQGGAALVVAPTSVCNNWSDELTRFAPSLRLHTYASGERVPELASLGAHDVLIISYGVLQQRADEFHKPIWNTTVLDEAQLIKNSETRRARAAFGLSAGMRIAATGTPVENHLGDIYSIFRFLMPDLVGSWSEFAQRYAASATGEAADEGRRALRRLLAPFILRRTKAQVLEDLPPVTEIQRTVELSPGEAKLYAAMRRDAIARLVSSSSANSTGHIQVLSEITRLRQLCCHPRLVVADTTLESSKLATFMELLEELRAGRHRALVFSQFVGVLALCRELLDGQGVPYQYLDGSTPTKQRKTAVDAFQAGEGEVFLISLKAGGFGLNLTGADYVIHLDPWWNPAVESQASNRAHRIGQTRPVTIYRLVTAGTIEERIVELHRNKRELADSILADAENTGPLSSAELRALLDG